MKGTTSYFKQQLLMDLIKVQTLHFLEDKYSITGSFFIFMLFYTQSFHCYCILEYIYIFTKRGRERERHSVLGSDESQTFHVG